MGRRKISDERNAELAESAARVKGLIERARAAGALVRMGKLAEAIGIDDETLRAALKPGTTKFPDTPEFSILLAEALGEQLGEHLRPEELFPHFARYATVHPHARLIAEVSARRMRGRYGLARRDKKSKESRWRLVEELQRAGLRQSKRYLYEMIDGARPFPTDRASLEAIATATGIRPRLLGSDMSEAEQLEPMYRQLLARKLDTLTRSKQPEPNESAALSLARRTGKVASDLVPVLRRVVEEYWDLGNLARAAGIESLDRLFKLLSGLEKPAAGDHETLRLRKVVGIAETRPKQAPGALPPLPIEPERPVEEVAPVGEPAFHPAPPAPREKRPRGPAAPVVPPSRWHGNQLLPPGWSDTVKWNTLLAVLAEENDWMTRKQLKQALQEKLQCSPAIAYRVIAQMAGQAQSEDTRWFAHPEIKKDLLPPS